MNDQELTSLCNALGFLATVFVVLYHFVALGKHGAT